ETPAAPAPTTTTSHSRTTGTWLAARETKSLWRSDIRKPPRKYLLRSATRRTRPVGRKYHQRMMRRSAMETIAKSRTESPDDRKTVAYSTADRKLKVLSRIRAPSPRSAPTHSPTIAPITQVVAAIFRAENR